MKRFSNEAGTEAGVRNWGRFALMFGFFWLAVASSVWLGTYVEAHQFKKELSQEERRAIFVGAYQRPTAKIRVETPNETCLMVTHADLDGVIISAYVQNNCDGKKVLYNFKIYYQAVAPNGTLLEGSWLRSVDARLSPERLEPGEQGEFVFRYAVDVDDRTAAVRIWFESDYYEKK